MTGNDHIEVEDLAMFALLLLSEGEARVVREHLRGCALCSEELLRVREDLATYALSVEALEAPTELPDTARDRFMSSLADDAPSRNGLPSRVAEPARPPTGRPELVPSAAPPRERFTVSRILLPLGWAVAAALLLVMLGLRQDRNALRAALETQNRQMARTEAQDEKARRLLSALTGPGAVRVSLSVPKAPISPTARAMYEPRTGTLLLTASSLAPLPAAKVYELWLIPADGGSPIPAGTFSPDGRGDATVLLPTLPGAKTAKAFGITMEPAGGSLTPTLPILLAGAPA